MKYIGTASHDIQGASTNIKFIGIGLLDANETLFKKFNNSFVVHFHLSKYSLRIGKQIDR